MRIWKDEFKGEMVRIIAEKRGDELWVHVAGETHVKSLVQTRTKRSGSPVSNQITAPMPGKILRVVAQVGDAVEPGMILVMMEAMKMEYSLKAQVQGKVKAVHVKAQDLVSLGKVLVELE